MTDRNMSFVKNTLKSVYKAVPLKRTLFTPLRPFIGKREGLYKHLYFQDDIVVPIDRNHSFKMRHFGFELENKIFWAGLHNGWEKTSISLWTKLVTEASVIIDIGANTGLYSLIAKSLKPSARVYAFGPVDRVFEKLEHNVSLNGFDIVCTKAAISNTDGEATIYDLTSEHIYSVAVNKNLCDPNTEVIPTSIKTIRLDTFIAQHRVEPIDLMKIDVETHEPEVLEGFGKYLEMHRPTMLIEVLTDELGVRIEKILSGMDYLYFNLDERTDSIRKVDSIVKSDFYNYLICDAAKAARLGLVR